MQTEFPQDTLTSDDFMGEASLKLASLSPGLLSELVLPLKAGTMHGSYAADVAGSITLRASLQLL